MAFSRRSLRPLAVVLTLSSMAGCASPVPGVVSPAPTGPVTAEAPVAAPATTPGAPAPAAVVPVSASTLALTGVVTFRGEPVAASSIALFDARTGAKVTADRLTGSSKTDAQGRFSLQLAGAATGEVYRLIAAASPKAGLAGTFLVTASGIRVLAASPAAGYHVAEANGTDMAVNETSTTLSLAAGGALRLGANLTPTAAQPGVETYFTDLANAGSQVASNLNRQPNSANRVVEMIDPSTGWVPVGHDDALAAVLPRDTIETATRNVLNTFNTQANEPSNRLPGLNPTPVRLPGLGVSAGWSNNQSVTVLRSDGSSTGVGTPGALRAPSGSSSGGSAAPVPTPVVGSLSTTSGLTTSTTALTITGTGFTGATGVQFGAIGANTFTVVSDTQITATAPISGLAGTVGVTVTTLAGSHTLNNAFTYAMPAAPPIGNIGNIGNIINIGNIGGLTAITVTSLGTTQGSTDGGTTVLINGSNFNLMSMTVNFGGTVVPFDFISATQISVVTPAHAAGAVDVVVSSPMNMPGTLSGGFTYVAPPAAP